MYYLGLGLGLGLFDWYLTEILCLVLLFLGGAVVEAGLLNHILCQLYL